MMEPEEKIEARLMTLISAAVPDVSVEGALTPALEGESKTSDDTFINVAVDVSSQRLDLHGRSPFDYTARISVHFAQADDKEGLTFREVCRSVRGVIADLTGDMCEALNFDGFLTDSLLLNGTNTSLDSAESGIAFVKVYNLTIVGRNKEQN